MIRSRPTPGRRPCVPHKDNNTMSEPENLTDEMIAGRRHDPHEGLPQDMPLWMKRTILAIDTFSLWVGRAVAWLLVPMMFVTVYEVMSRYFFNSPTVWAYDLSRMLCGAMFIVGAAYALSKGVHIRSDFLFRKWHPKTQGRVESALYLICFFPAMLVLMYVCSQWAWSSLIRGERGTDTAWMPLLGPVRSALPIGIAFLIIQGVSELLKALNAARSGKWPQ